MLFIESELNISDYLNHFDDNDLNYELIILYVLIANRNSYMKTGDIYYNYCSIANLNNINPVVMRTIINKLNHFCNLGFVDKYVKSSGRFGRSGYYKLNSNFDLNHFLNIINNNDNINNIDEYLTPAKYTFINLREYLNKVGGRTYSSKFNRLIILYVLYHNVNYLKFGIIYDKYCCIMDYLGYFPIKARGFLTILNEFYNQGIIDKYVKSLGRFGRSGYYKLIIPLFEVNIFDYIPFCEIFDNLIRLFNVMEELL